jgi:predicted AAA+ superfamily ATPase
MIRTRLAAPRLRSLLRQFPAVAVLGPRQIGKSTLAVAALRGFTRFDLEDPADYAQVARDPAFLLAQHPRLILDEAQRLPELFPVLRSFLDAHPRHRVVLLGSASPFFLRRVSESLAGRVGLFELGGISAFEDDPERLWLAGGFPRVHWSRPRARPADWYPAYLRTCLEADIPRLDVRVSPVRLRNLLTMIAHGQGGVCNLSELGRSLGLDYHSVAHLIDVFEAVFLVRRLQPWFANLGKRLVKSPKLYVRDTGLLHSLLGIPHTRAAASSHPKVGASFETFCIEQLVLHASLRDPGAQPYFFRTHTGLEVDLLLKLGRRLVPIEIKLGAAPPDLRNLEGCMELLGLSHGYVVHAGAGCRVLTPRIRSCGLREALAELGLQPK